jgi:signal transduction histidine kinase
LLARGGAVGGPPRFHPSFFPLFWLLLIVLVFVAVSGSMRRLASPVGNLVEAAGRIEAGDYSVRVAELGPAEVRSMARALNAMSAHLQAAETQRRSFLADVAHELKTPLSIIRGQAEGIADGVYPGDAEHLTPIIDATRTLERLVDDLRTLTLSEAGNLRLQRERVDPGALVRESIAAFRSQAAAAGVTLRDEIAADLPEVDADPLRISGVLSNLLANGLAHTPSGGSLTVTASPSGNFVEIAIHDTGSGIEPELLPRIFDRFVKGPSSHGSGLGLAIARDLITAHGGRITAKSQPGTGTTIRFTLPAAAS